MENIKNSINKLISEAYQKYYQAVYPFILYKIGHKEDAEALSQDVFLHLMDYKQMLHSETIKSFIFSISHNLIIDYWRKREQAYKYANYLSTYSMIAIDNVESQIITNDLLKHEYTLTYFLPDSRRKIYRMSRFEEKTPDEISKILGISVGTVHDQLFIGRKKMREYMKSYI